MSHRGVLVGFTAVVIVALFAVGAAQVRVPGAQYDSDFPNEKPGPAPRRDIAGIWEPARGPSDAIQATGARNMPDTGRPELRAQALPARKHDAQRSLLNRASTLLTYSRVSPYSAAWPRM